MPAAGSAPLAHSASGHAGRRSSSLEVLAKSEPSLGPLGGASLEVNLQLTPEQVLQLRARAGLLGEGDDSLFGDAREAELEKLLDQIRNLPPRTISRSFVRGLVILSALPRDGSGVGVIRLAEALGMSASTVHRYLTTFVALGLVQRSQRTREYSRLSGRA